MDKQQNHESEQQKMDNMMASLMRELAESRYASPLFEYIKKQMGFEDIETCKYTKLKLECSTHAHLWRARLEANNCKLKYSTYDLWEQREDIFGRLPHHKGPRMCIYDISQMFIRRAAQTNKRYEFAQDHYEYDECCCQEIPALRLPSNDLIRLTLANCSHRRLMLANYLSPLIQCPIGTSTFFGVISETFYENTTQPLVGMDAELATMTNIVSYMDRVRVQVKVKSVRPHKYISVYVPNQAVNKYAFYRITATRWAATKLKWRKPAPVCKPRPKISNKDRR